MESRPSYSIAQLSQSKSWRDADRSHNACTAFWADHNADRERCFQAVLGKHFTNPELAAYRETSRVPIVLSQFPSSRRTVLGMFLSNRYDVEFVPVGDEDQELADALRKLSIHEDSTNNDLTEDAELAVSAWVGGDAPRIFWPETNPGEEPYTASKKLNPFAVYWDPESTDLTNRSDARFVDVVVWMSVEDILDKWPNAKLRPELLDGSKKLESFDAIDRTADRAHESRGSRNGLYKIIERYYKVRGTSYFVIDSNQEWLEVKDPEKAMAFFGDSGNLIKKKTEFLYVAQWAPDACQGEEFLYNDKYHVQPRHPKTRKILWPIVSLVAESVNSFPRGFVVDLVDANKMIDALVTNVLESAKHSPSAYEMDESAYISKDEADRAAELGPHSNQRFRTKPGRAGTGMVPIQKAQTNADHDKGFNIVKNFISEQSSTPPAVQGLSESDKPSGVLNGQRIEQAYLQMSGFIANFRAYRKAVLTLRYAYWRECYTDELVFRITGDDGKSEKVAINQEVQAQDEFGYPIPGQTVRINDIQSALYDVTLVDSVKSPTFRDKQLKTLEMLIQSNAVASDPQTMQMLLREYVRLGDMSNEIKQFFDQRAKDVGQHVGMQQQLEQAKQMQEVAQTEAEQTAPTQMQIA